MELKKYRGNKRGTKKPGKMKTEILQDMEEI